MKACITTHNLDFEAAPWECMGSIDESFTRFRIGTCEGLWTSTGTTFDILAVTNESPGNGHFEDVIEWFTYACKRDQKDLRFLEVWNKALKKHLIGKRGFKPQGNDNLIKPYRKL